MKDDLKCSGNENTILNPKHKENIDQQDALSSTNSFQNYDYQRFNEENLNRFLQ